MFARILDWLATHREVAIAFVSGLIVGGVLGSFGAVLK